MPRTADANSCLTCRRRRIRCDNRLPRCQRCEKKDVYCDRSNPLVVKQYSPGEQGVDLDKTPQALLGEHLIAKLFHVYIKDLAPWYDLSDETRAFEKDVVEKALESPLLFSATIAFAAIYVSPAFALTHRSNKETRKRDTDRSRCTEKNHFQGQSPNLITTDA
jgi:hypothetical protein